MRYERTDTKVLFGGIVRWGVGYKRSNSRARATASVRLLTCNLPKMFRLCPLTVGIARKSRSLICRFERP